MELVVADVDLAEEGRFLVLSSGSGQIALAARYSPRCAEDLVVHRVRVVRPQQLARRLGQAELAPGLAAPSPAWRVR
jgi:hypothetical protein